jgi:predicted amidohydrolase
VVQQYLQQDQQAEMTSRVVKMLREAVHAATECIFFNEMMETLLQAPGTNG